MKQMACSSAPVSVLTVCCPCSTVEVDVQRGEGAVSSAGQKGSGAVRSDIPSERQQVKEDEDGEGAAVSCSQEMAALIC